MKDARRGRESECRSLISWSIDLASWAVGASNEAKLSQRAPGNVVATPLSGKTFTLRV